MFAEISPEEFAISLDRVVDEILAEANWSTLPIDTLRLAKRLGVEVVYDDRQNGRARRVTLSDFKKNMGCEAIVLRPDPRPERLQWAIAHEIGERHAHRVFEILGIDPREAPNGARETVANLMTGRLLLPSQWFHRDAVACGWNLLELKQAYSTASHELIARRMLDFESWVTITVYDNGQQTFRRSNRFRVKPEMTSTERDCQREVADQGLPILAEVPGMRVWGWPIHEPEWRREILRAEREETWDEPV
jgi:Zn-dependent peptidase ImmA (M78 family)